jgi:nicotinamide-nucleotide amidase
VDAHLIAVGSELLQPGYRDTNSAWLSERLARVGATVRQVTLVGDDADRIADLVRRSLDRASVVLLTGGLGPTADDRTREGVARALGAPLEIDDAAASEISAFLRRRGREATPEQIAQALRPAGAETMRNPVGTAPGILARQGERVVAALPGVPAEMRAMFLESLEPLLRGRSGRAVRRRILKIAGRTESSVDGQVSDLYRAEGAEVTILAKTSGIQLVLNVEGRDDAEAARRLESLERAFAARLGADLFGRDDDTLASVVGCALVAAGQTVATAESCTAGLLAAAITETPGSSEWFRGGLVAYANDLKSTLACVRDATIAAHGAVSEEVAEELAQGARTRCAATWGLGVTGVAGPGGGTESKPVGLVWVGVAGPRGSRAIRHRLGGDRELIRARSVTLALDLLRRELRDRG